jgi:hypothetical protein
MRKFIIAAVALVALVVPTAAVASVAVDATGNGVVGKGDVQSALSWNNEALDKGTPDVKFTVKTESLWHQVFRCNGVDYINDITTKRVQPITAAVIKSSNGKQITGWNLSPNGIATGPTTYSNPGAWNQATLACFFSGGTVENVSEPFTSTSSLYVNDVPLPNTPVAPIV